MNSYQKKQKRLSKLNKRLKVNLKNLGLDLPDWPDPKWKKAKREAFHTISIDYWISVGKRALDKKHSKALKVFSDALKKQSKV